MGFFKNLGDELGTGTGKGIVAIFSVAWKIISVSFTWWLGWKPTEEGKSWLQTNSLRIAVTSFILACFIVPGLVTMHPSGNLPNDSKIETYVQLGRPPFSLFPSKSNFEGIVADIQYFYEFNGIKYIRYQIRRDGKPPQVVVDEPECVIVPAGKGVRFIMNRPPLYAVNMTNDVLFLLDSAKISRRNAVFEFFYPTSLVKKGSWKDLRKNFDLLERPSLVLARAMDWNDIPPPHYGGLVCF